MQVAGVDGKKIAGIGCRLVNPPAIIGGGSISQLSAGISIKNFNDAPRKRLQRNDATSLEAIGGCNRISTRIKE